jgi:hypothetical protein
LLQREENCGDNMKHHGHTLLGSYPENGLKRSGFCAKLYLYKMTMIQVHGGSQYNYSRLQQRDADRKANAGNILGPGTHRG